MPEVAQARLFDAIPPMFRKVVQVDPLKRATTIPLAISRLAQMALPALSPLQAGAFVVLPVTVLNALQTVPLKNEEVNPPAALRAAHNVLPAAKTVQLGSE
jgi:hypothetical protein